MKSTIKMYAVFARETLEQMLFEGKLAAQAGHAYLHAWWDAEKRWNYSPSVDSTTPSSDYRRTMYEYKNGDDARKIALVVDTVDELYDLYEEYRPCMGATIVEDCGYTVFTEPTITAVGLGPVHSDFFLKYPELDKLTRLETLKNELIR